MARFGEASLLGGIVREPTIHFSLLAAVLFVVAAVARAGGDHVVEIDRAELAVRLLQVEIARGAPLTPEERRSVEEGFIDERILVREALALGLDQDERIHDILAQKMLHVLSGDVIQPTDAELRTYYEANRERYMSPGTVTVEELVVTTSEPLPAQLADQLAAGTPSDRLTTDLPLRRGVLPALTLVGLADLFGWATAELISEAATGSWVGPHHTVRGQHWFRLVDETEPAIQPLDAVRPQLRLDWITEREEALLVERVAELRERYTVVLTGGGSEP